MGRLDHCLGIGPLGQDLLLADGLLRIIDLGKLEDFLQEADAIGPDL